MKNKQILGALSMDLKRIALGLHRGSISMALRFEAEAKKRIDEIEINTLQPYMKDVLIKINSTLSIKDLSRKAEDMLMYSTIVQNYVVYK